MQACKAKKVRSWNQDSLELAIQKVKEGMSVRSAAQKYCIPKSTLYDYVTGKVMLGSKPGPSPVLSASEEQELVDWALEMSRIGYGRTKLQIFETVKKILDKNSRPNPFPNNYPGKDWWYAFLCRHPELSLRTPEALQIARVTACTTETLHQWYVDYSQFLLSNHIEHDSSRIWNADETGCPLCPWSGRVLAERGLKDVYQVTGNSKEQITTLCAISAAGNIIPPMHIYPGKRFKQNPLKNAVDGSYMGKSDNGWMTTELFYGWLANHFSIRIPPGRPVVLLVDGHSTHVDLEISKFAKENGILLYCLPPHSSHITQPLDVGFYGPLKSAWKKAVAKYTSENMGMAVTRDTFASVFREAYDQTVRIPTIVNSFRNAGIFPVDFSAIRSSKLSPSAPYTIDQPQRVSSPVKSGIAPQEFDQLLRSETRRKFHRRYDEEYDVEGDEFYAIWKKMKEMSLSKNAQVTKGAEMSKVSNRAEALKQHEGSQDKDMVPMQKQGDSIGKSVLDEILVYPKPKISRPKTAQSQLPKHLTSDQMIRLLQEKEEKKRKEEEDKAKRKLEREEKKKKKEEDKLRRQKERQNKREAQREKKIRGRRGGRSCGSGHGRGGRGRGRGRGQVQDRYDPSRLKLTSSSSDHSPSPTPSDQSDTICPVCATNQVNDWIAYDSCDTWYHRNCVNILPHINVEEIDWYCPLCEI